MAVTLILLAPPLLSAVLPAASVGWSVLALLGVTAVILGWVDGKTFRSSWSFPLTAGAAYFADMLLYFNEGTWIYLPVLVILAAIAGWLGDPKES
ncbi:hypothetical protein CDOO_00360 [Corynebacterium doosanense CAU 212 = DSM 45436]|uniref:Uncharacterized protein n=1 Tax=Corynebacterium doosanense CAU 212 = DSM 45436 TaxID=558173 RepID=A0A097ICT1_9CORY|nr:hypothetical protein CDOO_00360 [Corynebacterium doosanense CAU 212 = DSM 45436]